jgi:hypothetical protein
VLARSDKGSLVKVGCAYAHGIRLVVLGQRAELANICQHLPGHPNPFTGPAISKAECNSHSPPAS